MLTTAADSEEYACSDVDDTIVEVHGHQKQGSGYGYSGVRGLNALLATVTTPRSAPVIVAGRLRKGSVGSPRGAARLIGDAVATTERLAGMATAWKLVRASSTYYGHAAVPAALAGGADVSVTVRMDPAVKKAIATVVEDTWTPIKNTDAVYDEDTGSWISSADVAEVEFTVFTSKKKTRRVDGRLVVRRIPELNKKDMERSTLFDTHRLHSYFTTSSLDTVAVEKTHRAHAIIEQVNTDLKDSALAHLPSGVFTRNAA